MAKNRNHTQHRTNPVKTNVRNENNEEQKNVEVKEESVANEKNETSNQEVNNVNNKKVKKNKTLEELIEEAKQGPGRLTAMGIERYIKNIANAGVDIKKIGNIQYDFYRTIINTLKQDDKEFKKGIILLEKAFILKPEIFNSVALLRGELEWPGTIDSRNQYAVLVVMFEEISHPNKRTGINMKKVYEYLPEKIIANLRSHYRLG